jgi:hypothetical protein
MPAAPRMETTPMPVENAANLATFASLAVNLHE